MLSDIGVIDHGTLISRYSSYISDLPVIHYKLYLFKLCL